MVLFNTQGSLTACCLLLLLRAADRCNCQLELVPAAEARRHAHLLMLLAGQRLHL
jgi:hypothetical protein